MQLHVAVFVVCGLFLLTGGAEFLVRGSSRLALRLGLSSLVVGLTVVAFGTSAPELVVSIKAGLDRAGDIAVGNVVGSNIFNIAAILGLAALVRPLSVHRQVLRIDTPVLVAVSLLLVLFLRDRAIGRGEALVFFAGIVSYVWFTLSASRKQAVNSMARDAIPIPGTIPSDIIFILAGLAALVFGSRLFVSGATGLARAWGVSEAVIGLTIVAAGTSLPELATSVVAAVKKETDIAVGNIIGSNIFNILAILGISGLLTPLQAQGIGSADVGVMMAATLILIPFMRTGFVLNRVEGAVLLALYCGYVWYLLR
ncbi:MAG: hypothetical protein A2268_04330 [Candidatus Raymondbacteria bacterium RifOxyA12_full_50_37]|uniref:Sodium/calcium exchanger membrane region domain-containing protein n=1 Tax=Candidatus Raymondbacteria bacterium RIFOXYD12_FULL_49_13 TaxID=1817890 RepID=A0A1F7FBT0_UNCRA|nr:MAG: hypothetical protein A2268_04330 [Candidatus Raymondbacteria bacterium RifOxyA12_full_50_37]OGJ92549.1 MAG: hypothetical protein A2248_05620 [Candidatus Raymondbacteria bacterium RIFOXYA2_FULL_49_16]OGJ97903.1 MAG: hypothetical protein A2453_02645 [Candidatus Raymondbacteria bacterium RIFOXYC2_FULL_50_21]OGK03982.1 MAG: hypothetical protein A2519_04640 [Candidatus Raymondbacteria bacterium RIFOXYD12_FULL_49_13]OGP44788.1 MAG: hypothetical protein A2324_21380 [Candidatus Raymondbacteria 